MARPLRIHVPGMPYHLTSLGNANQCIFEDERDHLVFLALVEKLLAKYSIECLAYCLLWSHFHLVVVPTLHTVSRFMQDLNSDYCRGFNRRHGRRGHVLGDRFDGPVIEDTSYLLSALRYVALNPVEAGRTHDPAEWRWSSYRATAGLEPCPPFLSLDRVWRGFDTTDPVDGRDRYVTFVKSDCAGEGFAELQKALYRGGRALGQRIDPLLEPHRSNAAFTYQQRYATRPPLAEILDVPDDRVAREDAARIAFFRHAYTLGDIGAVFGRPASTIWFWIKRAKERLETAPQRPPSRVKPRRWGQSSIFE